MAGGGEEKAVFVGLKNDAQEALPKIAEKDAELVDTTVAKGTKGLAEHVKTEDGITADLKSRMPAAPERIQADATRTAASAGAGESGAASASESPVRGSKLQQMLEHDDGAAADMSKPQFGSDALRDEPSYNDDIDKALEGTGVSREEYDRLRVTPTNDLSPEDLRKVVSVRNSIKIKDGQMVTKVLKPNIADGYLDNDTSLFNGNFKPDEFGGSIARGSDTADLDTPAKLRDGLALDDSASAQKWSPIPEGSNEAYQLRLPAPDNLAQDSRVTYGAVGDPKNFAPEVGDRASLAMEMGGQKVGGADGMPPQVWDAPFTGTGYTEGGVPEWTTTGGVGLPERAEIWKVTADGQETMMGYYDGNAGEWTRVRK